MERMQWLVGAAVVLVVAVGCGRSELPDARVVGLAGEGGAPAAVADDLSGGEEGAPDGATGAAPGAGSGADAGDAAATADGSEGSTSDDVDLRERVDDLLARYARVLTDVAEDPAARSREGSPTRAAWDATVQPDGPLSGDVLGSLVRRHLEQGIVVVPGPGGLSYRHHPLRVEPPVGDTISFTWCGWSPGIGIDQRSGEVVDDGVAHAHGTGQLRLFEGRWVLEALDELDLRVLPAGSADPCLAEVAGAAGAQR